MFNTPQNVIQQLQMAVGLGNVTTTTLSSGETIQENTRYYAISNQYYKLAWMPMTFSICSNILTIPAEDAFRQSVEIITQDAKADDITKVDNWLEKNDILRLMKRFSVTVAQFGGGGIIIDDHTDDPSKPFDINKLKKGDEVTFIPADRWELITQNVSILSKMQQAYDAPKQLRGATNELTDHIIPYDSEVFYYYSKTINSTRVLKKNWDEPNSLLSPVLMGWGASVFEPLIREINQFIKSERVVFEFLDKAKATIIGIPNLRDSFSNPSAMDSINQFIQQLAFTRDYKNINVVDLVDEIKTEQLDMNWIKGFHETMVEKVCSAVRIPPYKLYGRQVASMGGNSENQVSNIYNEFVQSSQQQKFKDVFLSIIKIGFQVCCGYIPEDLTFNYKPLSSPSLTEKITEMQFQVNTLLELKDRGMDDKTFWDNVERLGLIPILPKSASFNDAKKEIDEESGEAQEAS